MSLAPNAPARPPQNGSSMDIAALGVEGKRGEWTPTSWKTKPIAQVRSRYNDNWVNPSSMVVYPDILVLCSYKSWLKCDTRVRKP